MKKIDKYIIEHFKEYEETMSIDELLLKASSYGIIEYIQKYLDMGADVNGVLNKTQLSYEHTPLYFVTAGEYIECAEYLVRRGADVNFPIGLIHTIACTDGDSYFFRVSNGEENVKLEMPNVEFLLRHKADMNVLNLYDENIIESVIKSVTPVWAPVIDFLLENGADINLKNSKGQTPLDIIIKEPYEERATEFLIKRGAKLSSDLN